MLEGFPKCIGSAYSTDAMADEISEFFGDPANTHPVIVRAVAQTVEGIRLRADLARRESSRIDRYLTDWAKRIAGRAAAGTAATAASADMMV
jgi:hypothetical protein